MSTIAIPFKTRPPSTAGATTDVVYVLSTATWQAASRRGFFMPDDRLALSLLASERVGRLLICNHPRTLPTKVWRDVSGSDRVPFPADDRTRLVEPVRLRRQDPKTVRGAERGFAAYDRALGRAVRRYGLRDPVAIIVHPIASGFAPASWARSVTWYALDDWAQHPAYSRWWDVYRENYLRVRTSRRRVAAVSSVLLDRIAPTGPSVVVPNGLEPTEWISELDPPEWVSELGGPLLVYAGTLDARLDVAWLTALAAAEPSATIALVGTVVAEEHLAPLRALPNVRFTGPLGRGPLVDLIRAADVGLLPHRVTPLTAAMSPLKVLEYLAAGLPVAATDLSPVRAFGDPQVVLVPEGGDYTQGVRTALARGRTPEHERLEFIRANSWRARHDELLDLALQ
ncbi:MAG: glycosyltransferase [Solirubrobacteraceae bacterium]